MTQHAPKTDEDKLNDLAVLTGHSRYATVSRLMEVAHSLRRARGYTARGALVLGFVAPIVFRKPSPGATRPPEGWTVVMITNHLLEEMNGVWWAPDEAVPALAASWKYVTRREGQEVARSVQDTEP